MGLEAPDLYALRALLGAECPDLGSVAFIRILGQGFSSLVVETDGGVVFKIALSEDAAKGQAKEAWLLPRLQSKLPVPVPEPRWCIGPARDLPFGAIGYRKLNGIPLQPQLLGGAAVRRKVARALGAFLHALHSFPTDEICQMQLPGPDEIRRELELLRAEVIPELRGALTRQEYVAIVQWWDAFLGDTRLRRFRPVVQHGDFWYENILVDPLTLDVTGVIDFEDSALGDAAQDFATLLYHGEDFVKEAIAAYRVAGGDLGEDFAHRVQRYWELRDFRGGQWAIRHKDAWEFYDSIGKLRRGPILRAG